MLPYRNDSQLPPHLALWASTAPPPQQRFPNCGRLASAAALRAMADEMAGKRGGWRSPGNEKMVALSTCLYLVWTQRGFAMKGYQPAGL